MASAPPEVGMKVHKARRASMEQISNNFEDMDSLSSSKMKEGCATNDRSEPVIEPGTVSNHEQSKARRASLVQIENGFAQMDSSSASKLKEGVETLDRSGPMISPDVTIKPAPHKEAFKEAATVSTTKAAKRASMIQIADGFVNIENDAASRLSAGSGAESNDRSAPQLDQATEVDHSFATSRRSSLHQIKDGFANMAPESASNLKMGVATHDRSAPSISPDVTLKPAMHKEAAKDAAIVSAVKSAKRASMGQIADGFANMDETTAHRLSASDVDVDDRSEPRIDASATPTHEFAGARRASMAAIDGFAAVEPLAEASTHDRSGAMIAPDITLKMSVHREAAAEAAEKAGVTSAKRASLAQIADGFENMDPAVAQRLSQSDVDVDDRSQPVIDAQTELKHEFAGARRASMAAIDGFAAVAPLAEFTDTDDRSEPILDGSTELKQHNMKGAVAEAAMKANVTSARRASMAQIADGFAGLTDESASKLNEGTESDDRSVPSIDPALQPSHEFAKARRASIDAMTGFNGVAPLNEIGEQATYGDRSAPAVCGEATIGTVTGGHATARRASLTLIEKNNDGA